MELLLLLIIPVLIALGGLIYSANKDDSYYKITLPEFFVLIGVTALFITGGYFASRMYNSYDKELWNGRVADKKQEWTSCEHSYQCNPHPCGKDGKDTCYETCYEHFRDYDWNLYTTNHEKIEIARIDRQGSDEPSRFTKAKFGDPTAVSHSYKNYIKGNPWSILRRQGLAEKFKGLIPEYPIDVYDYHYVNRFLSVKVPVKDITKWNNDLMQLNADLGKKKQVNVILLAVNTSDSGYIHALEEAWLGGKKNDIVIIFGITEYPKIDWVRVVSWTSVEDLKIALRDNIQTIGNLEKRTEIITEIRRLVEEKFVRRKMADFEYLAAGISPPFWILVLLFIGGIGVSVGLMIYFLNNDPFKSRSKY